MPGDSVTIRLEGEVEIGMLSDAFVRFAAVLEELPRSHNANVRWVLAGLDFGSAIATARALPLDDHCTPRVPDVDASMATSRKARELEDPWVVQPGML